MTHVKWSLFEDTHVVEWIFWVSNFGYVTYELWDFYDVGFSQYFSDWTNIFDMMIVFNFLVMMMFRIWATIFSGCVQNSPYHVTSIKKEDKCEDYRNSFFFLFCKMIYIKRFKTHVLSRVFLCS